MFASSRIFSNLSKRQASFLDRSSLGGFSFRYRMGASTPDASAFNQEAPLL